MKFSRIQIKYGSVYRIYLAQENIMGRGFVNNVMNLTF
jgi:hypothetical protein